MCPILYHKLHAQKGRKKNDRVLWHHISYTNYLINILWTVKFNLNQLKVLAKKLYRKFDTLES